MIRAVALMVALSSGVALANPAVKKDTDVGKRKSKKHYQVTRQVEGRTEVYEVVEFDKAFAEQGTYSRQCFFVVEGKKRFMACNKEPSKPEVITITSAPEVVEKLVEVPVEKRVYVEKTQVIENKKNRLTGKVAYGFTGLERDGDLVNSTSVSEGRGLVLGVNFSRLVTKQMSLGLDIYTNGQFGVSAGFDF